MAPSTALIGKVIAITGVSSGIGRAAARAFAAQGAKVVGIGRREARGRQIAEEINGAGHAFTFVAGDVTDAGDCQRLIDVAVATYGHIDALVNNVGGAAIPAVALPYYIPTDTVTPEQFDASIAMNLRSAFFCAQAAIKQMKKQGGGGAIVNVSSVVGNQAMATQVPYAISKAALDHLTRCLAAEFLEDGIRVNTLIIGGALTGQSAAALQERAVAAGKPVPTAETLPAAVQGTGMNEILDALAFLCSDQSRGVTATAVAVDRARSAGALFSSALLDALSGQWTRPAP